MVNITSVCSCLNAEGQRLLRDVGFHNQYKHRSSARVQWIYYESQHSWCFDVELGLYDEWHLRLHIICKL